MGGSEAAVRYSILAARRSAAQLAFEDASRHYRTAIALLEPNDPARILERCELLLSLGEAELQAGEREASRATLKQVAELARSVSAADLLARAALGLSPGLFAIEAGVIDPLLISLLEEALTGLGTVDSALRASVLARLAIALVWSDAETRRDALSHEALAVARRVGDPGTLGLALIARHGVLWAPNRLHERVEVLAELGGERRPKLPTTVLPISTACSRSRFSSSWARSINSIAHSMLSHSSHGSIEIRTPSGIPNSTGACAHRCADSVVRRTSKHGCFCSLDSARVTSTLPMRLLLTSL